MERWKHAKDVTEIRSRSDLAPRRGGSRLPRSGSGCTIQDKVPRDDNLSQPLPKRAMVLCRRDTVTHRSSARRKIKKAKEDESTRHGAPQPIRGAFRWRMWALLAASIDLKRFLCMKAGRPQFKEGQSQTHQHGKPESKRRRKHTYSPGKDETTMMPLI